MITQEPIMVEDKILADVITEPVAAEIIEVQVDAITEQAVAVITEPVAAEIIEVVAVDTIIAAVIIAAAVSKNVINRKRIINTYKHRSNSMLFLLQYFHLQILFLQKRSIYFYEFI